MTIQSNELLFSEIHRFLDLKYAKWEAPIYLWIRYTEIKKRKECTCLHGYDRIMGYKVHVFQVWGCGGSNCVTILWYVVHVSFPMTANALGRHYEGMSANVQVRVVWTRRCSASSWFQWGCPGPWPRGSITSLMSQWSESWCGESEGTWGVYHCDAYNPLLWSPGLIQ